METLTRAALTAALAARQMLLGRERVAPAEAIRHGTPLQAQHAPAAYIALAARLDGFAHADLEAALCARAVVKTTIMRATLHLAAASEYPAHAELTRQARLRAWRRTYPHLDEERVVADLAAWLREPRTNADVRERVREYPGVTDEPWTPVNFARTLLPLVQLPPAGRWADRGQGARFVVDPSSAPGSGRRGGAGADAVPGRVTARAWRSSPSPTPLKTPQFALIPMPAEVAAAAARAAVVPD